MKVLKMMAIALLLVVIMPLAARAQVQQRAKEPIYTITINVVERTTKAVNYQHRSGSTTIDFQGTALMPAARGEAKVESKQGYMEVEVEFDNLQSASRFGPEFLTYVLWAITPQGRATNMGEVILNGTKSKLDVTTELQAFGMIVTAEPYFAVSQPSNVVVMDNIVRKSTAGKVEEIDAKYELLQRGQYTVNALPAELTPIQLDKNTPLDLYEARNAVRIAKWAGADVSAADTFDKASKLLDQAEAYKARKAGSRSIAMTSREAVQTAEDARLITLKTQAEARLAQERAASAAREATANTAALNARAAAEEAERQSAAAQARSERTRLDAEVAAIRAAEDTRVLAERTRAEADLAARRSALEKETAELRFAQERAASAGREATANAATLSARADANEAERSRAAAQAQSERASLDAELAAKRVADDARSAAQQSEREKSELRARLASQLNLIFQTKDSARGLIVNMSDLLFDTGQYSLSAGAREKLARISGIVLAYPSLKLEVEGHTDSVGADESNMTLSERRAGAVRDFLVKQGVAASSIVSRGFGRNQPVASNDTAAGRQQNRRVELVVSGEATQASQPLTGQANQQD